MNSDPSWFCYVLLQDSSADVYKKINKKIFYVSSSFAERDRMKEERFAILCDFFSMKLVRTNTAS